MADPVSPLSNPEILKRIIYLHQVEKLGAEAIANKLTKELGFQVSRAPVGKQITKLKAEGKIKDIPYSQRKAAIDQRGDFFGKPAGDKYLAIREVRDIDRTTKFKDTGKLKYNIPKNAKFKVDFKNPSAGGAAVTDIPDDLRGVQYYATKEEAEQAVAKRKKLQLVRPVDLNTADKTANKKKYDLVKEVSDNNIESKLTKFKVGEPLEQAHRLSLNQVKSTNMLYNVMNLGLDSDQVNNKAVKPYENKLKQLYTEQNKLYNKAKKLKTIPKELSKQIELNNKKISTVVDLAGGRVQGIQLDELTLTPRVTGTNYANVLGFGLYDKPVKELTDIDRAEIGVIMQSQINNEKKTASKTAKLLFENQNLLKDVDTLALKSMVPNLTTASEIPRPEKALTIERFKTAFKNYDNLDPTTFPSKSYVRDELKKVPVNAPVDRAIKDFNIPKGTILKGLAKGTLRAVAPFVPFVGAVGVALGVSDVAKAKEEGLEGEELGIAYLVGPELAKKYSDFKDRNLPLTSTINVETESDGIMGL
tara:strand:+ start:12 stop:1607 length:1596 start_codon:yes stop_codon:yes gene_type:complete